MYKWRISAWEGAECYWPSRRRKLKPRQNHTRCQWKRTETGTLRVGMQNGLALKHFLFSLLWGKWLIRMIKYTEQKDWRHRRYILDTQKSVRVGPHEPSTFLPPTAVQEPLSRLYSFCGTVRKFPTLFQLLCRLLPSGAPLVVLKNPPGTEIIHFFLSFL